MNKGEQGKTPLPFTAKACMFLVGFSNFFLGYAIYYVMYDSDREKAEYFRKGAIFNIIVIIFTITFGFVLAVLGIDIDSDVISNFISFLELFNIF